MQARFEYCIAGNSTFGIYFAQVSHFSLYALAGSLTPTVTSQQTIAAPGTSVPAGPETGAAAPAGEPQHLIFLWAGVVVIVRALIGAVYFLHRSWEPFLFSFVSGIGFAYPAGCRSFIRDASR